MVEFRALMIEAGAIAMGLGLILAYVWREDDSEQLTRVISALSMFGGLCLFWGLFLH